MKKLISLFLILSLLLGGCTLPEGTLPAETEETPPQATHPAVPEADTLTVHFIDVGQADCALLECGGEYMLIDGGNVEDGQLVVSYLEQQGVEELNTVICTHAHEDHVGGLPAVLAVYPTAAVLAPTKTYSSGCFDDFMYYVDQQGLEVEIPSPGDVYTLGGETQGASILVLGPVESYADTNNTSIVLMVTFGDNRFLFTGDMETDAEADMLDHWEGRMDWNVDVLKVGHHGSSTSTSYRFLYETDPAYAVISVGEGNSYGHPHEEVISRLNDAGITIFRTDDLGTIVAVSDGKDITFTWDDQSAEPENAEPAETAETQYIGNVNSKKFHSSTCSNLPKEENRTYFSSYQEAIDEGYTPCSNCLS